MGPLFLLSIVLGAAVFVGILSSLARILSSETIGAKMLRWAHGASMASGLFVMAALSSVTDSGTFLGMRADNVAAIGGIVLAAAAAVAIALERGWHRLSLVPLIILGVLVATGAPFVDPGAAPGQ